MEVKIQDWKDVSFKENEMKMSKRIASNPKSEREEGNQYAIC